MWVAATRLWSCVFIGEAAGGLALGRADLPRHLARTATPPQAVSIGFVTTQVNGASPFGFINHRLTGFTQIRRDDEVVDALDGRTQSEFHLLSFLLSV